MVSTLQCGYLVMDRFGIWEWGGVGAVVLVPPVAENVSSSLFFLVMWGTVKVWRMISWKMDSLIILSHHKNWGCLCVMAAARSSLESRGNFFECLGGLSVLQLDYSSRLQAQDRTSFSCLSGVRILRILWIVPLTNRKQKPLQSIKKEDCCILPWKSWGCSR